ncbi:unnamed protein product [Amoebophrya sp. A120]|nr:unnamed protein product [Amoebophrya sp. A120]|eukprot:GSA120T00003556001.1
MPLCLGGLGCWPCAFAPSFFCFFLCLPGAAVIWVAGLRMGFDGSKISTEIASAPQGAAQANPRSCHVRKPGQTLRRRKPGGRKRSCLGLRVRDFNVTPLATHLVLEMRTR